MYRKQKMISTP
jgi:hypothetical protein